MGQSDQSWESRIVQWAEARNLIEGSTPTRQLEKLKEEMNELVEAIRDNDDAEAVDAIGDCCVVLAIIAKQLGHSKAECEEAAWLQIKDRKGRMVDGIFVKEI